MDHFNDNDSANNHDTSNQKLRTWTKETRYKDYVNNSEELSFYLSGNPSNTWMKTKEDPCKQKKAESKQRQLDSLETFISEILSNQSDNVLVGLSQGNSGCLSFCDDISVAVFRGPIAARRRPVLHAPVAGSLHAVDASATVSSGLFTRRLSTVVPRWFTSRGQDLFLNRALFCYFSTFFAHRT